MKTAAQVFEQIKQRLALHDANETTASTEEQAKIIELLKDCLMKGVREENLQIRLEAIKLARELLREGQYGFAKSESEYMSLADIFSIKKMPFYRLDAELEATAKLFNDSSQSAGEEVKKFLKEQKRIRLLFDNGINYGNQSAGINLLRRLQQMGFTGICEIVGPAEGLAKVASLLGIKFEDIHKQSEKLNIQFIEIGNFIRRKRAGEIEDVNLSLSGAVDAAEPFGFKMNQCSSLEFTDELEKNNFANFLQAEIFIQLEPYYKRSRAETRMHIRGIPTPIIQKDSKHKALIVPIASLAEAKDYLHSTVDGQKLLKSHPGIKPLIHAVQKKQINFFPAYGNPLKGETMPENIINLLLGAQYAKKNGPEALQKKPAVIGVFYDFGEEKINELLNKIHFYQTGNQENISQPLTELLNQHQLKIIFCKDPSSAKELANLTENQIALVIVGRLPKIVFDGVFTLASPQIIEGASALSNVLRSGKPHVHCDNRKAWDIDLDLAEPALQQRLEGLNKKICIHELNDWQPLEAAKLLGEYIIDSFDHESELVKFFQELKKHVELPANDRILIALHLAQKLAGLSTGESLTKLSDHLYKGYFTYESEYALPPEKVMPDASLKADAERSLAGSCGIEDDPDYFANYHRCLMSGPDVFDVDSPQASSASALRSPYSFFSTMKEKVGFSGLSSCFGLAEIPRDKLPLNTEASSQTPIDSSSISVKPSSLNENLIAGFYLLQLWQKYFAHRLPGNTSLELAAEAEKQLRFFAKKLNAYKTDINNQKKSCAGRDSQFADLFAFLDKNLLAIEKMISQIYAEKKYTYTQLKDIQTKLQNIEKTIHDIAKINKQLRRFEAKLKSAQVDTTETIIAIRSHDPITQTCRQKIVRCSDVREEIDKKQQSEIVDSGQLPSFSFR